MQKRAHKLHREILTEETRAEIRRNETQKTAEMKAFTWDCRKLGPIQRDGEIKRDERDVGKS